MHNLFTKLEMVALLVGDPYNVNFSIDIDTHPYSGTWHWWNNGQLHIFGCIESLGREERIELLNYDDICRTAPCKASGSANYGASKLGKSKEVKFKTVAERKANLKKKVAFFGYCPNKH